MEHRSLEPQVVEHRPAVQVWEEEDNAQEIDTRAHTKDGTADLSSVPVVHIQDGRISSHDNRSENPSCKDVNDWEQDQASADRVLALQKAVFGNCEDVIPGRRHGGVVLEAVEPFQK
jgi:hypothetical protein